MVHGLLPAEASPVAELGLLPVGASPCGGFSLRGLLPADHRLQAHWLQELQHVGSVVVAHGLSCSVAYGIFLDQRSILCPVHWQANS